MIRTKSPIRILPDHVINRIAAGEVVERPAGAIKELVENAIDANCSRITITIEQGGKKSFTIEDNGNGIPENELTLALTRHATSKIYDGDDGEADLVHLEHFGFRGEALASLSSVSHLMLESRHKDSDLGYMLISDAGHHHDIKPSNIATGTRITVRNIFAPVPARLKFLKSDRSEQSAITDVIKRLSMAHPDIGFTLRDEKRVILKLNPALGDLFDKKIKRISDVVGTEFIDNAMPIDIQKENIHLEGLASLPTYHRGNGLQQYLYVNGRAVRDKMLTGVLRAAYAEHLARDRHPICVLFITLPYEDVDVNVHPTKAEVRFKHADHIRGLIISAIRSSIANIGHKASNHTTQKAVLAFEKDVTHHQPITQPLPSYNSSSKEDHGAIEVKEKPTYFTTSLAPRPPAPPQSRLPLSVPRPKIKASLSAQTDFISDVSPDKNITEYVAEQPLEENTPHDIPPMGYAKGQVHETYIIAQTAQDMIIVDQHAAHERIILEKVKDGMKIGGLKSQNLLVPEIITLGEDLTALLEVHAESLLKFGLVIEKFGLTQILVRAVPAFLIKANIKKLVADIADDLADEREPDSLTEKINLICATYACHHSIRAGRKLSIDEMNHLLREMEKTEGSGQCNHGRPTYIRLKKNDIERLFGRK